MRKANARRDSSTRPSGTPSERHRPPSRRAAYASGPKKSPCPGPPARYTVSTLRPRGRPRKEAKKQNVPFCPQQKNQYCVPGRNSRSPEIPRADPPRKGNRYPVPGNPKRRGSGWLSLSFSYWARSSPAASDLLAQNPKSPREAKRPKKSPLAKAMSPSFPPNTAQSQKLSASSKKCPRGSLPGETRSRLIGLWPLSRRFAPIHWTR